MKTKLFFPVCISICICMVMTSCTPALQAQKENRIAQAIKREGDVYYVQGDYTAALGKLLEAEKIIPDDPDIQYSLGLAYMGKSRYDLAIKAFKKSIASKPNNTEALNNLGAVYLLEKQWGIAIKTFNKVLEDITYPTPEHPLTNIGSAYMELNNYPLAQQYFLKALQEKPGHINAVHGLALLYIRCGQTDRAIDYLDKNIQRYPGIAILHADLAQAYETCGRTRQAVRSWQEVMQLAPENSGLYHKAEQRLFELR